MLKLEITRQGKAGLVKDFIHIGTIPALSQARQKIRAPRGIQLACEAEKTKKMKEIGARWCKQCYKELLPKQAVFCSIKCLAVHHAHTPKDGFNQNRKKREKPILNYVACKNPSCGKEFMQRSRGQLCCSKSCSAKLSNIKRRENNEMHKLQSL